MKKRHQITVVVFLILEKENKILLQKRINTGYMDNMYDLACSGHVDANESISAAVIREAKEEIGIIVSEDNLSLAAIMHGHEENYLRFFFRASEWENEPNIMESNKCEEVKWVNKNNIPEDTIPHVKKIIENLENSPFYETQETGYIYKAK